MIPLFLLLQVAPPPPSLGTLPPQQLPPRGCAAFLWTVGDGRLVAMAGAEPAQLRLILDGRGAVDLPRVAQRGDGGLGFAGTTDYRGGDTSATLTLGVVTRPDLRDGGTVPQATLEIDRPGQDALVVPLAGLVGCRG